MNSCKIITRNYRHKLPTNVMRNFHFTTPAHTHANARTLIKCLISYCLLFMFLRIKKKSLDNECVPWLCKWLSRVQTCITHPIKLTSRANKSSRHRSETFYCDDTQHTHTLCTHLLSPTRISCSDCMNSTGTGILTQFNVPSFCAFILTLAVFRLNFSAAPRSCGV